MAQHGAASIDADGNIVYTSDLGYTGNDYFYISYNDENNVGQFRAIEIDVLKVNHAPVAADNYPLSSPAQTNEDTPLEIFALTGATDPDGNIPFISSVENFTYGTASIS